MSFALNWFFSQDNTFGYHVVNICIHILTAFFLYLTCLKLLKLVLTEDDFQRSGQAIALFASLLWAANPMQTQAVTYIVQRMASLAALFSIIGILFYLKARTTDNTAKRIVYGIATIAAFLCAIASKENAIVFPVSLLLIEYIFFRSTNRILPLIKNHKPITFDSRTGGHWIPLSWGSSTCLHRISITTAGPSRSPSASSPNHGSSSFTCRSCFSPLHQGFPWSTMLSCPLPCLSPGRHCRRF